MDNILKNLILPNSINIEFFNEIFISEIPLTNTKLMNHFVMIGDTYNDGYFLTKPNHNDYEMLKDVILLKFAKEEFENFEQQNQKQLKKYLIDIETNEKEVLVLVYKNI